MLASHADYTEPMSSPVTKAREFAILAHGGQRYGEHPYHVHLDAVADLVRKHGEDAEILAYLHDVVEDTSVEPEEIAAAFGQRIAACVEILSDAPGKDRKERKRATYARMAEVSGELELALLVKAADRLANLRACMADGKDGLLQVYKDEHAAFRQAAWRENLGTDLWLEMDAICAPRGREQTRFYIADGSSLVRLRPGHDPEIHLANRWTRAPPSMLGAIYGQGDDVWSGPDYFADHISFEEAQAYALRHGIDLFAEPSKPESFLKRLTGRFR